MPVQRSKKKAPRDKCAAKARVRREAVKRAENRLYAANVPFEPYQQWFRLDRPADFSDDPDAEKLMDLVRELGHYYGGRVPMAALYLEEQIRSDAVRMAIIGDPDAYRVISVAEFAADVSSPEVQALVRAAVPGFIGDEAILLSEQEAAAMLHRFLADGMYIMDDDHCLHLTAALASIL